MSQKQNGTSSQTAQPVARPTHPDWRRSPLHLFWMRRTESGVIAYVHTHAPDRHVGTASRFAHMTGMVRPTIDAAADDAVRLAEIIDAYEREVGKVAEDAGAPSGRRD